MDNNKIVRVNINIADRPYPLNISVEKEEIVRKATEKINEVVNEFRKKNYKDQDTQDYLAMATLHFVSKLVVNETNHDLFPLIDELKLLNIELDEFIENTKKDVL